MFSLRRQIKSLDDIDSTFKSLIDAYGALLEAVFKYFPAAPRELFEEARKQGKTLRAALGEAPTRASIRAAQDQADIAVKDYGQRVELYVKQQEQETKDILTLFASVAESMAKRDKQNAVRFTSISKKLKLLSTSSDLSEIKWKLAEEVDQLERSVADMARENESALARLQEDLTTARSRPQQAVKRTAKICVAVFRLDGPSASAEDAITFVRALSTPGDSVTRHSEKELLLISNSTLLEMAGRAEAIRAEMERRFLFICHKGVAEQLRGESMEELTRRAAESARPAPAR